MDTKPNNNKRTIFIIIALIICVVIVALLISNLNRTATKSYSEMWNDIQSGNVTEIAFTDSYSVTVTLKVGTGDNGKPVTEKYNVIVVSRTLADEVKAYCEANNLTVPKITLTNPNSGTSWSTIISILSFVIIAVLAIILIMGMRGKGGNGGKSA